MVAGQKVVVDRIHQHQTVTVLVSDTTFAIDLGDTQTIRRASSKQSVASKLADHGRPAFPSPRRTSVARNCRNAPGTTQSAAGPY